MAPADLSVRAQRELVAAVKWISRDNRTAARGLRRAVKATAIKISDYPCIGHVCTELADENYRFLSVSGFPYIFVYNVNRNPPLIVRVIYGARDLPEVLSEL